MLPQIVIVIADPSRGSRLAPYTDRRLDSPLRHGRQPCEEMLLARAKKRVARPRSPRRHLTGQRDIGDDAVNLDVDRVRMQVTPEGARADAHIAALLGGGEFMPFPEVRLLHAPAVGIIEVQRNIWREGLADVRDGLRVEGNDELRAVVEVGVEVPPFVGPRTPVGAHPIFPGLNHFRTEAEATVLLRLAGNRRRQHAWAHQSLLVCACRDSRVHSGAAAERFSTLTHLALPGVPGLRRARPAVGAIAGIQHDIQREQADEHAADAADEDPRHSIRSVEIAPRPDDGD